MDKNFETYGCQSGSNSNNASQFIVVQNSGPFLAVNDRPIQYENLKENIGSVQPSIVYNVTPQQYYIKVDNSSELMSVPDQFNMPDGENNMYTNNYILPTAENNKIEQMEQDEFENNASVQINAEVEKFDCNTNGDCTEITLSSDQYQVLEQKGWLLLETTDKIYLLDTLGLHDITADRELIEKLKRDTAVNEDSSSNIVNNQMSYENEGHHATTKIEEPIDDLNKEVVIKQQKQDVQSYLDNNPDPVQLPKIVEKHTNDIAYLAAEHDYVKMSSFKDTSYRRDGEALRIKTKFSFKDIPTEIVLGRTVHGKKLVASVKTEKQDLNSALINKAVGEKFQRAPNENNVKHVQNDPVLEEVGLTDLLRKHLWGNTKSLSPNDVKSAVTVVEQLLRVPDFKSSVMERRLFISKVVNNQQETGKTRTSEILPTIVTGNVVKTDSKVVFKHIPELLHRLLATAQVRGTVDKEKFLHIHIQEIKSVQGITRISISLDKQNISLLDFARNKPNMVYACGSCAAIYDTEEGLKLHYETDCTNTNNLLSVDAVNSNNNYSAIFTDKGREYMCNQCHSLFTKLSSCQIHVKNNCSLNTPGKIEETGKRKELFNCIMCDSTFQHQGSLSKHLITKHIKMNTK